MSHLKTFLSARASGLVCLAGFGSYLAYQAYSKLSESSDVVSSLRSWWSGSPPIDEKMEPKEPKRLAWADEKVEKDFIADIVQGRQNDKVRAPKTRPHFHAKIHAFIGHPSLGLQIGSVHIRSKPTSSSNHDLDEPSSIAEIFYFFIEYSEWTLFLGSAIFARKRVRFRFFVRHSRSSSDSASGQGL